MTDFEEIGDRVAAYVPDDKTETDDIREYIEAQGLMSNNGQSVGRRTVERTASAIAAGRETPEPEPEPEPQRSTSRNAPRSDEPEASGDDVDPRRGPGRQPSTASDDDTGGGGLLGGLLGG
jgi:hypothetical protein